MFHLIAHVHFRVSTIFLQSHVQWLQIDRTNCLKPSSVFRRLVHQVLHPWFPHLFAGFRVYFDLAPFSQFFFLDQTWWENTDQPWLWSPIKSVEEILLPITRACIRVMEERNIQEHLRDGFRSLICVTSHHRMPWCQIAVPTHHPSFGCRSRSIQAILNLIKFGAWPTNCILTTAYGCSMLTLEGRIGPTSGGRKVGYSQKERKEKKRDCTYLR
jgi:hypothetical protein